MSTEIPTVDQLSRVSIHRPHQSESLQKEIRALEWALQGRSEHNGQPMPHFDGWGGDDPQSREYLEESLTRTKQLYERHAAASWAERFDGYQKNKLYQAMKQDEDEIRQGMPTHEMMEEPNSTNVDWWRAWHASKKKRILAWRARRRILDPRNDDPNFGNIAILRTHELTGGDPRKYWSGYEQVAFTERVEDAIDQISDAQYLEFLKLKALDWAPTNICRKLGWSKTTYQAAWHRLQSQREDRDEAPEEDPEAVDEAEAQTAEAPERPAPPVGPRGHPARIDAALEERGIKRWEVAKALKVHGGSLAAYLNGKRQAPPSKEFLVQFDVWLAQWDKAHLAPVVSADDEGA